MSKSNENKLVPKLRFIPFSNGEEWEEKSLGEVLIKNSSKNRAQNYSLVQSISNKYGFIDQDEYFENRRVASRDTSNYYIIEKGYFAYNPSRIDVGSLAYKQDDKTSIISPLYVSFKANNKFVEDFFLLYFFSSVGFTKQMIFEGGVRNTLNYENLIQIKIPVPTLEEQQRIAACHLSLDEVIVGESRKLEILRDHKKGLLQNLLPQEGETIPKFRFREFEDSEDWEEKLLDEVAEFLKGKLISKADIDEKGKQPCIRYGELYTYYGEVIKDIKSFTNLPTDDLLLSEENDVIIPSSGETREDIATASCVKLKGVALGGDLNVLRSKLNGEFLAYYLSHGLKKAISKIAQGDAVVHLYSSSLKKLKFIIPPTKDEQNKIADTLSSIDDLINAQSQRVDALKLHKKGLLQGLFPDVNEIDK